MVRASTFGSEFTDPELTQRGRQTHKSRRSQPNFLAYLAHLKSRDQTLCARECRVPMRTLRVNDGRLWAKVYAMFCRGRRRKRG
jgi:hypothetical protein